MRFSIITATYNAETCIERTIQSVLNQNSTNYEYIFIDGASVDNTNMIIDQYSAILNEKGIQVKHVSEPDNGISDAFAKGVNYAQGEIVVILNAGDKMLPDTLSYVDSHFSAEYDVLYGNIIWHDEKRELEYIKKSKSPEHLDELKYTMVIKHPATYIKKKAYVKYGNYDATFKYAMDTDLLLRMYLQGAKFKYIDREFTYFEAGGVSDSNLTKILMESKRIAISAGEKNLVIKYKLARKYIHHKLAHFVRYYFMKNR